MTTQERIADLRLHVQLLDHIVQSRESVEDAAMDEAIRQACWDCIPKCELVFASVGDKASYNICLMMLNDFLSIYEQTHRNPQPFCKVLSILKRQIENPIPIFSEPKLVHIQNDQVTQYFSHSIERISAGLTYIEYPGSFVRATIAPHHSFCRDCVDILLNTWCLAHTGPHPIRYLVSDSHRFNGLHERTKTKARKLQDLLDIMETYAR